MSKLTVGTYKNSAYQYLTYSIRIAKSSARPDSNRAFVAEVYVADEEGDVIDSFNEYGGEDWQLRNACIKRIMTEANS